MKPLGLKIIFTISPIVRCLKKIFPTFYYPYPYIGGRLYANIKESYSELCRILSIYERDKTKLIRRFLSSGGNFIDIGAHRGYFTLLAAKILKGKDWVFAIEPDRENFYWLKKGVTINKYNNIKIYNFALSDTNGYTNFYLKKYTGMHTITESEFVPTIDKRVIETYTLDYFWQKEIKPLNLNIDLMKIDTEGAEIKILEGGKEMLKAHKKMVILMDLHPHLGVDVEYLCNFLRKVGFNLFYEDYPLKEKISSYNIRSLVAIKK